MKRKILSAIIYAGANKIAELKDPDMKFARPVEKITVYGASYAVCPRCGHVLGGYYVLRRRRAFHCNSCGEFLVGGTQS